MSMWIYRRYVSAITRKNVIVLAMKKLTATKAAINMLPEDSIDVIMQIWKMQVPHNYPHQSQVNLRKDFSSIFRIIYWIFLKN